MISHVVGVTVLVLLSYGIFLVSCERWIIYHPYKYPEGNWSPSSSLVSKEDVRFIAGDGVGIPAKRISTDQKGPSCKTQTRW